MAMVSGWKLISKDNRQGKYCNNLTSGIISNSIASTEILGKWP